ncbi:hypothetical protein Q7P37_011035 [Cladosporium fusiforme]
MQAARGPGGADVDSDREARVPNAPKQRRRFAHARARKSQLSARSLAPARRFRLLRSAVFLQPAACAAMVGGTSYDLSPEPEPAVYWIWPPFSGSIFHPVSRAKRE